MAQADQVVNARRVMLSLLAFLHEPTPNLVRSTAAVPAGGAAAAGAAGGAAGRGRQPGAQLWQRLPADLHGRRDADRPADSRRRQLRVPAGSLGCDASHFVVEFHRWRTVFLFFVSLSAVCTGWECVE